LVCKKQISYPQRLRQLDLMKWIASTLADADKQTAAAWIEKPAAAVALGLRFERFVKINHLETRPFHEQLALVAAQMRSSGLAGTTIVTYLHQITQLDYRPPEVFREVRRVIGTIEYSFRHDEIRRAPEVLSGEIHEIVGRVTDPYARVTLDLMLSTYMRVGDISEIAPSEVSIKDATTISIMVVGGKTHRKFADRDLIVTKVSPFTMAYIVAAKAAGLKRLVTITSTEVSAALTAAAGRKLTSYSVRNMRILKLIESETNEERRVNWHAVMQATLHRGSAALKSAYQHVAGKRSASQRR
jgi:hypothetical protein